MADEIPTPNPTPEELKRSYQGYRGKYKKQQPKVLTEEEEKELKTRDLKPAQQKPDDEAYKTRNLRSIRSGGTDDGTKS